MKQPIIFLLFALCLAKPVPRDLGNGIHHLGVNDPDIKLFEGQYPVENGMAYNSYAVIDGEDVAIIDTVDKGFLKEWFENIQNTIGKLTPKYLIVNHMEPDHSANIDEFAEKYPKATLVSTSKAFKMMKNYFKTDYADRRIVVKEGDTLAMGKHTFAFVEAPFVHWPEVMVTYEVSSKTLFSADGFGKFGVDYADEPWDDESRRYFIGIVGKYGEQVQELLKKAATLDIHMICPTHGPVLTENLGHYIQKYLTWSSYEPEEEGVLIAYTSVYGHTKEAVDVLAEYIQRKGTKVVIRDLTRVHYSYVVADAFRYSKIVLATTTYNAGIFPAMRNFIDHLTERNFQKKTVAFIENGSWGPIAAKIMKNMLKDSQVTILDRVVTIKSALNEENKKELEELTKDLLTEDKGEEFQMDTSALFNIGYGLYVITSNDGQKDNGFICNSVMQLTSQPLRIAVNINKADYSYGTILKTSKMNLNILNIDAPFDVFVHFGFQSGKTVNKFENYPFRKTTNGLAYLTKYVNSVISLNVVEHKDVGTHGLFICEVTESRVFNKVETMTYSYYQKNVKPQRKPAPAKEVNEYVCRVCGYEHKGETLPSDIICPICKHTAIDFEKVEKQ